MAMGPYIITGGNQIDMEIPAFPASSLFHQAAIKGKFSLGIY